ncbi:MAG: hypothetical protein RL077_3433 [Verrucomicrobiota bacterium]
MLVETGEKRDRLGRRITPVDRRAELVAAWRESGLTQTAFARREGIKYTTFCGWAQTEHAAGRFPVVSPGGPRRQPAVAKKSAVRFVEAVEACPSAPSHLLARGTPDWEVRLPDGTVLRGPNATDLAALVRAIRS